MKKLMLFLVCVLCTLPSLAIANGDEGGATRAIPSHEIWGLETHAYTQFKFVRVSEVEEWTPCFEVGAEVIFPDNWYGTFEIELYDVLSRSEVFNRVGDQSISIGVGRYW